LDQFDVVWEKNISRYKTRVEKAVASSTR
jgi:hypothetical protein